MEPNQHKKRAVHAREATLPTCMSAMATVSPNTICAAVEVTGARSNGHSSRSSGRCTDMSHSACSRQPFTDVTATSFAPLACVCRRVFERFGGCLPNGQKCSGGVLLVMSQSVGGLPRTERTRDPELVLFPVLIGRWLVQYILQSSPCSKPLRPGAGLARSCTIATLAVDVWTHYRNLSDLGRPIEQQGQRSGGPYLCVGNQAQQLFGGA